jgi:hypothetical protein
MSQNLARQHYAGIITKGPILLDRGQRTTKNTILGQLNMTTSAVITITVIAKTKDTRKSQIICMARTVLQFNRLGIEKNS